MHFRLASVGFLFIIFSFLSFSVEAQTSASLSGRVLDAQRSVVAGATVDALHVETNAKTSVSTNDSGLFVFADLKPGVYRISAGASGFQITVKTLTLNVAARVIEDFELSPGDVSAEVTVAADAELIERESAAVSTVVTRDFVENIPLNGRSFQSLLELTPGVVLTPSSATNPGQFSVNGQRTNSNYFTVDGVSVNAGTTPIATSSQQAAGTLPGTTVFGGFNNLVTVEELQEFRVQTSSFAAEYGRTPGGQVGLLTRSGANRFSGSVYDYVRNDIFDSNTFFNSRSNIPRGKLRQNFYGFALSGPLPLPNFGEGGPLLRSGKDRTFFFLSYEGLQLRQPIFRSANVPSQLARDRAASLGLTHVSALLAGFPLANAAPTTTDPLLGRFEQSLSNPIDMDTVAVRVDHDLTPKLKLAVRFKPTVSSSDQATTAFPNQSNFYKVRSNFLTVTGTYTASSNFVFDGRFVYYDDLADYLFTGQEIGGAVLFPLASLMPNYIGEEAASASVQLGNLTNQTRGRSFGNGQRQWSTVGSATMLFGNHEIKVGGDYRRLTPRVLARSYGFTYNFTSLAQVLDTSANSTTLGTALVSVQALAPAGAFLFENVSAFAQDTWRATRSMTITFGTRWDLNTPPSSDGPLPYTLTNTDDLMTATLAPAGTSAFEASYANFSPRLGIAYSLGKNKDLVIRGGVGTAYDLATGQATRGYTGYPFSSNTAPVRVPFVPGSPALLAALQPGAFNANPPYASEFYVYDRDIKLPQTLQYNIAVEKMLGSKQAISVTFVGARGYNLLFTEAIRNSVAHAATAQRPIAIPAKQFLNPIFGTSTVSVTDNRGRSDYKALQIQFDRRMSRGLQLLASYSLASSKDNISSEIASSAAVFRVDPDIEWAPSDFDVRHTFTAAGTYRIPAMFKEGFGKALTGGFAVDVITRARSAAPFNAFVSYSNPTAGVSFITRPDLVAGQDVFIEDASVPGGRVVNTAAFAFAPVTRQGTLERNALRAFPLFQTDLSLRREFKYGERMRLQLRGEAFNLFNQVNFSVDSSNLYTMNTTSEVNGTRNLTFGQATNILSNQLSGTSGTGFSSLYTVGGARSLQFAAKFLF